MVYLSSAVKYLLKQKRQEKEPCKRNIKEIYLMKSIATDDKLFFV